MSDHGLGPLPKLHVREKNVIEAANALRTALNKIIEKHDLTTGEELRVVNEVFSGHIGNVAKYAIRRERHGKKNKPGGTA